MIAVMGRVLVESVDAEAFAGLALELMQRTREESGCVAYAFARSLEESGEFWLQERWRSLQDLEAHFATPHIARFREGCVALRIRSFQAARYDVWGEPVNLVSRGEE